MLWCHRGDIRNSLFMLLPQLTKLWPHKLLNCGHNLVTCGHNLVTCGHNLLTCGHNLLSCGHKLNCGHNLVTCGHNLVHCGHNLITCGHKFLSCGHNINKVLRMSPLCHHSIGLFRIWELQAYKFQEKKSKSSSCNRCWLYRSLKRPSDDKTFYCATCVEKI